MKRILSLILITVSFNSFAYDQLMSGNRAYKLVWAEEFEYSGLPATGLWGYETGYVRNKEYQFYTVACEKNARVSNGVLTLTAYEETYTNPDFNLKKDQKYPQFYSVKTAPCTSASIHTLGTYSFKYGKLDISAKVPKGKGVWPAVWMMGTNREEAHWPRCGEIDIMEYVGKDPSTIWGTVHYARNSKQGYRHNGGKTACSQPWDDFHTYSIEWDETEIRWLFDNTLYHSFKISKAGLKDNPFQKPFYLILNLAIGGSWGGTVDPAIFPAEFKIDYVRYYKELR